VRKALLAPNGYLHAGTIVTFADTLSGYGCIAHLAGNAENCHHGELRIEFLNTRRRARSTARRARAPWGGSTDVWDAGW